MKKMTWLILGLIGLFLLIGLKDSKDSYECDGLNNKDDLYDRGYEAACEGEDEPSFWASKKEKDGYEEGVDDSEMYDDGYDDAIDRKKPEYPQDSFYMDGYKDGKKNR